MRPISDEGLAVGRALERRGVKAAEFAAPPEACGALCGEVGEPVLPKDGADFARRGLGKRIGSKKG